MRAIHYQKILDINQLSNCDMPVYVKLQFWFNISTHDQRQGDNDFVTTQKMWYDLAKIKNPVKLQHHHPHLKQLIHLIEVYISQYQEI